MTMSAWHAVVTAVLAVACASGSPSGDTQAGTSLAFEPIVDESSSGLGEPLREVVRDEARWARLWEQVYAGVTPRPPRPPVDFSRQMLIAVAAGTRPTGGFDIAVRAVTVRGIALDVEILESCPPPDAMVSAALTHPVMVVRLDALALAPAFRETKTSSCR
jgi:hypothetical protein